MAAEIKDNFQIDSNLIEGASGIFDVKCDADLIYSKHQNGNEFPEHEAVLASIRGKLAS